LVATGMFCRRDAQSRIRRKTCGSSTKEKKTKIPLFQGAFKHQI
jgi:hypothetical protein